MRSVEAMEARLVAVETQLHETDTRTLANQLKIVSNQQCMDQQFHPMNETLTSLGRRMHIVEEITRNWNRMQQELMMINIEVAVVREAQKALTTLMEGISTRLDTVGETEPPPEGSVDPEAARLSRAWEFDGSGTQALPMERLGTIHEVASTKEDTAPAVTAHPWSGFAPLMSLP